MHITVKHITDVHPRPFGEAFDRPPIIVEEHKFLTMRGTLPYQKEGVGGNLRTDIDRKID